MKSIVSTIAAAVRRAPLIVVIVTVVAAMALGGLGANFEPSNDDDDFAPEAPELLASDTIQDLFGDESSRSVLQIVVEADGADVVTLDGLATVDAMRQAVESGSLADRLAPQPGQPPVLNYLAPVEIAISEGAPAPTTDEEVKELYRQGLAGLPDDQQAAVLGMLPETADQDALSSPSGLVIAFATGASTSDEWDEVTAIFSAASAEIREVSLPGEYVAEPFAFELLFDDEDFEAEVGRLFATAGFIILMVLALVFLVWPSQRRSRVFAIVGIAAMLVAAAFLVVPSLAESFPSVLPDAMTDWSTSSLLLAAVATFGLVFILWTAMAGKMRRSVADTLVTIVGIFFAISIMNGVGYLIYGEQSPMAQILPILLIGLGVDYSIHLSSRYREEVSDGESVEHGVGKAIRTVGVALLLATIATSVGFLTNLTSSIPALQEFGVLAAIGIGASFLIMMTFIPAVRLLLDRRAERADRLDRAALRGGEARMLPRLIGRTSWLAKHAPVPTLIVALLLGGAGAFGVTQLEAKFSFLDFVPTTSPVRTTFETILEDYDGGFGETTQALIEGDVADAETWNAMVDTASGLAETDDVVVFNGSAQAQSPVSLIAQMADPESEGFEESVAAAAAGIGLGPDLRLPNGADVEALYDAAFAVNGDRATAVLHPLDGGGYDAALFMISTQAGEERVGPLRDALDEGFQPLRDNGAEVVVTSNEIISEVVVNTLRDNQVSSLGLTLIAVLVLLVAAFWYQARRPLLGLITTLPVVLVVLSAFGLMAAFGIPFGPITATVAALAVGIGIPYMIHITHRYEEDRLHEESEHAAIESTLTHTGGALAGSALTTVAGFGILVTSTSIPFRQFGFVTAYTILLSMMAAVLVLPSMLVLWDRWHRRRGDQIVDVEAFESAFGDVIDVPEEGSGGEGTPGAGALEGIPRS